MQTIMIPSESRVEEATKARWLLGQPEGNDAD